MKFTIDKDVLLEKLNLVSGPALQNHIQPILTTVKLSATKVDGYLSLEATDMNFSIFTNVDANIKEIGTICIPARNLLNILNEMPKGDLNIELVKNQMIIKQKSIELKLNLIDEKEFPKFPEEKIHTSLRISSKELERMLYLVSFCVNEKMRLELSSVLFEIAKDKMNVVGTDGKRIACVKNISQVEKSVVVPIQAIRELFKILRDEAKEVTIRISDKKIIFLFAKTVLISSLLESEYPDYDSFIPKEKKEKLTVDRKNLLSALKRANSLDDKAVKIDVNKDSLLISKANSYFGEIKEKIKATYNDEPVSLRFNAQYLIDVLNLFGDEKVNIEVFAEDKPIVMRKENYTYLALPIVI